MRYSGVVVSDDEAVGNAAVNSNARSRRPRAVFSDEELDGDDDNSAVGVTVTPSPDGLATSSAPPILPTSGNPNPNPTTLHDISDEEEDLEDFVTVPGDSPPSPPPAFFTPSPPATSNPGAQDANSNPRVPPVSAHSAQDANSNPRVTPVSAHSAESGISNPRVATIDQFLRRLGLCVRREWLEVCSDRIAGTMQGYDGLDDGARSKKVFEQVLFADLNECGAGVLPENVGMMHKAELDGPFVLQVDEIVNISAPIKERYQNAPAGPKRCMKLSMTDGVQRVFGIEYRPIKELEVLAPSGFKVVVRNVQVRRGLLMLVPEIMSFLGGMVDDLDQARQRLVSEVNKPPRGKRKQGGIPLSRQATLAAWSASIGTGIVDGVAEGNMTPNPAPQRTNTAQQAPPSHSPAFYTASGVPFDARNSNPNTRPNQLQEITMVEVNNSNVEISSFNQSRDSLHVRTRESHISHGYSINCPQQLSSVNEPNSMNQRKEDGRLRGGGPTSYVIDKSMISTNEEPSTSHGRNLAAPPGKEAASLSGTGNAVEDNDMVVDEEPSHLNNRRDSEQMKYGDTLVIDRVMAAQSRNMFIDDGADDIIMDSINDNAMDDMFEIEDSPFTYMSSLLARWAEEGQTKPFIRGKIKCLLTGVKSKFGYKHKFELDAYIDDGSLISLVKIDHSVIQKWVGYTPEEVVAGLQVSGTKAEADIRRTMRNYQEFLCQFEGTVVIEINERSDIPIAIEMNQGCSSDDASLLLRRLLAMVE